MVVETKIKNRKKNFDNTIDTVIYSELRFSFFLIFEMHFSLVLNFPMIITGHKILL